MKGKILNNEQKEFINVIIEKIRQSQYNAQKSVNKELINLYWEIGKSIAEKRKKNWGKSIVQTLSSELQKEFPGIRGVSVSNIHHMVQFYKEYHIHENLQTLSGEISWSKHVIILQKCKDFEMKKFYILATKKFNWSFRVLRNQIDNKTYERFLLNQTNFDETITKELKNKDNLVVKDEYIFDFLGIEDEYTEKELELALIKNIRSFLIEMGFQFTFVANQFKIDLADKEYYIDLLLYHRQLKCLVAIELKIGEFKPEYKGKMEFYLNILNDKFKLEDENDSIGILICKEKNRTVVEYSLMRSNLPIGVARYKTTKDLPKDYENLLPHKDEIIEKVDSFFQDSK